MEAAGWYLSTKLQDITSKKINNFSNNIWVITAEKMSMKCSRLERDDDLHTAS